MPTLYIIKADPDTETWDQAIAERRCRIVATVTRATNAECEAVAADASYTDPDAFCWAYTDDMPRAADAIEL